MTPPVSTVKFKWPDAEAKFQECTPLMSALLSRFREALQTFSQGAREPDLLRRRWEKINTDLEREQNGIYESEKQEEVRLAEVDLPSCVREPKDRFVPKHFDPEALEAHCQWSLTRARIVANISSDRMTEYLNLDPVDTSGYTMYDPHTETYHPRYRLRIKLQTHAIWPDQEQAIETVMNTFTFHQAIERMGGKRGTDPDQNRVTLNSVNSEQFLYQEVTNALESLRYHLKSLPHPKQPAATDAVLEHLLNINHFTIMLGELLDHPEQHSQDGVETLAQHVAALWANQSAPLSASTSTSAKSSAPGAEIAGRTPRQSRIKREASGSRLREVLQRERLTSSSSGAQSARHATDSTPPIPVAKPESGEIPSTLSPSPNPFMLDLTNVAESPSAHSPTRSYLILSARTRSQPNSPHTTRSTGSHVRTPRDDEDMKASTPRRDSFILIKEPYSETILITEHVRALLNEIKCLLQYKNELSQHFNQCAAFIQSVEQLVKVLEILDHALPPTSSPF